ALQLHASKPSTRLKSGTELAPGDKHEFYSHWHYSAVRLLTSISGFHSAEAVAQELKLPADTVAAVLDFLVSKGLCLKTPQGFALGTQRTHEPANSPHTLRHHQNWRLKALEKLPLLPSNRLAFTCPFTASPQDEAKLRKCLSDFVAEFNAVVDKSPAEKLYCLNLDWFDV
ncbi:DUF4423 domain-containing protein, partial [bacterium]|nr:DUF4423 domain-containing protein [bacterium]